MSETCILKEILELDFDIDYKLAIFLLINNDNNLVLGVDLYEALLARSPRLEIYRYSLVSLKALE